MPHDSIPFTYWPHHLQESWHDCAQCGEVDADHPPTSILEAYLEVAEARTKRLTSIPWGDGRRDDRTDGEADEVLGAEYGRKLSQLPARSGQVYMAVGEIERTKMLLLFLSNHVLYALMAGLLAGCVVGTQSSANIAETEGSANISDTQSSAIGSNAASSSQVADPQASRTMAATQPAGKTTKRTIFDYKAELALTDEQEQKLRQILAGLAKQVQLLRAKLTVTNSELQDLVRQEGDLELIKDKLREQAGLRASLTYADLVATRNINQVLTQEQWTAWRQLQAAAKAKQ